MCTLNSNDGTRCCDEMPFHYWCSECIEDWFKVILDDEPYFEDEDYEEGGDE